jgi:xanthine/CO dehydrogenase XdhC/CoxF family maturation factor
MQPDPFATHHRRILEGLEALSARRAAFTLCVVVHCAGSTYRKPGALALVSGDDTRLGVISGGCLESDLESAARAALAEGHPRVALFDTRSDDDLVFGSGSGCRGQMQVLLLPVAAGATHPLCEALLSAQRAQRPLKAALVTTGPHVASGFLWSADVETELSPRIEAARALKGRVAGEHHLEGGLTCAVVLFAPSPRVLLMGAGPEAPALINIANQLGWHVVVSDHREALLMARGAGAERTVCARPAEALAAVGEQRLDACIVMTHTAANDRDALAALARRADPFIGLLGPPARRDELLAQLDPEARAVLKPRLHAPVGIRLGGHGPEMLALAICAELQRFFAVENELQV